MKRFLPVHELARDERFSWVKEEERFGDPRQGEQRNGNYQRTGRFALTDADSPDRARSLMHGIFMGEVQALEVPAAPSGTSTRMKRPSPSSSTWLASRGTSPGTSRSR